MKAEFRTKLLQHLLSKKDSEKGFTLIELLVVIIIIGILAAIALPAFLNQANKAKQSEAKTYVSTLNKGQQAYFTQKGRFGNTIDLLGVGVPTSTTEYSYATNEQRDTGAGNITNNWATSTGTAKNIALRGYHGMVGLFQVQTTSDVNQLAIICEANNPGTAIAPQPANSTSGPSCSANSQLAAG